MKRNINRLLFNAGFFFAIAILAILGFMTYRASKLITEYERQVANTNSIIRKLDKLLFIIGDTESAQQGLILTDNSEYSQVYYDAVSLLIMQISDLKTLSLDNASLTDKLDSIEVLIWSKMRWMKGSIDLWMEGNNEAAIRKIQSGKDWNLMDSIRTSIRRAQEEEETILGGKTTLKEDFTNRLYYIVSAGGILSLLILSTIYIFLKKEIHRRKKISEELRNHRDHLNDLVNKRTEELNASKQRWRTTLLSIGDAVIATDEKGIITFINPEAEKITGWNRKDALGQCAEKVFNLVNENTLLKAENPVERVIRDGKISRFEYRTVLLTRDGRKVPVDNSGAPIKDEHGLTTGVILIFRDITSRRQAERALRESEERFSKAFHNNPAAISIIRLSDGMFFNVNDSFLRLFKYKHDEVIGMISDDLKIIPKEDHEKMIKLLIEKRKLTNFELTARTKTGEEVTLLSSAEIIMFNGEEHLLNSSVDVTERKKVEEALRESEQKLKYHFENSPLAVVEWDADYIVTQWSKEAERIFGWRADETLGKNINNLNIIYEEDIPLVQNVMGRLSSGSERTVVSTNQNYTKSGHLIRCTWYNSVLIDKAGKMASVMSLIEDITKKTEAEVNLKKAQEKLNIALENGNIGIWEWDLGTDELVWDSRMKKMFGVEAVHFTGKYQGFEELVNEEDLPHVRKAIKNALEGDIPFETIFRTRQQNGSARYISTKALINKDNHGKPGRMVGVCFDVTGMKKGAEQGLIKLNEELLRSNNELERFAYVASHDLQEPLRMISSYTQLLKKRYEDKLDQDAKDYIRFAVDGATRMQALINGLLAYSRIQTRGKEFTRVNMNHVAELVILNLRFKISERKADIRIDELPVIEADEGQMIQLIQNLISNSIKFSTEKPKIYLSCQTENDFFIFSIKDDGIGIAPEYFDRIFNLFQRLLPREQYEGTGLGLAICKRIIERHGGSIWLNSEPGKGTTFFFTIPKKKDIH